jgi:hypothetical protein
MSGAASCLRSLHDDGHGQLHLARMHSHWLIGSCSTIFSLATDVHGKRLQCDCRSILLGAGDVGKKTLRLAAISCDKPSPRGLWALRYHHRTSRLVPQSGHFLDRVRQVKEGDAPCDTTGAVIALRDPTRP